MGCAGASPSHHLPSPLPTHPALVPPPGASGTAATFPGEGSSLAAAVSWALALLQSRPPRSEDALGWGWGLESTFRPRAHTS